MKKTVYTKAGQVGLVEVERPRIEAPDDVILRIVRTCVCGSDLWRYRNPDIEAGHQNSGHEAGCKQSTSVSTLLIGPLSRFQVNHLIIQKLCSNPS